MEFNKLNLRPRLLQGIADRGYRDMTAVQELTLAETLQGRDVTVQSQTGTGKTAAFLVTLLERMLHDTASQRKTALVIVPTRELAVQIEKEAQLLNRHTGFRIGSLYGGVGYADQLELLRKGLDIVIGTPGRLLDFSTRGNLKLKNIGYLVIDEADRLFDMGFLPDITRLLERMPPRRTRQNMLFSATLNRASRRICDEHLNRPVSIEVTPEHMTVDTIQQELYKVQSHLASDQRPQKPAPDRRPPPEPEAADHERFQGREIRHTGRDRCRRPRAPDRRPGDGDQLRPSPGTRELCASHRAHGPRREFG